MKRDYKNIISDKKNPEPPFGLFERIISAIQREQEMHQGRRLLFEFLALLIVSIIATPFSFSVLLGQIESSGILYFISAAITDLGSFFSAWQDFFLAILEALPVSGILIFLVSVGVALFTLRLFLYKKKMLLKYLFSRQLIINQ